MIARVKIHFVNGHSVEVGTTDESFTTFAVDIFKTRIYGSITADGSPSLFINTDNILFVEELEPSQKTDSKEVNNE